MASIPRAVRLIAMMRVLEDRCYTCEELAQAYGVHPRTIRRDLAVIQNGPLYFPLVARYVFGSVKLLLSCPNQDRRRPSD